MQWPGAVLDSRVKFLVRMGQTFFIMSLLEMTCICTFHRTMINPKSETYFQFIPFERWNI